MSNSSLNSIWNVDAHLDLTIQDIQEGYTSNVEFTKIGLIDYVNNSDVLQEDEKLNYNIEDKELEEVIRENLGWELLEVRENGRKR